MPSPLENAEKRLEELRQEIARVERFIRDYHEFSGSAKRDQSDSSVVPPGFDRDGNVSPQKDIRPVDKWRPDRRRVRPDEIAQMVERLIRDVGSPMTRGQIVEALALRDVDLPAADKARYIGTIIWRHKSIFVNLKGRGYWLRDARPVETGFGDDDSADELPNV
jgi:hypothetical protein